MKVVNCQSLGEMCEAALDGEPVFLLRAQDQLATEIIEEYLRRTEVIGARNKGRVRQLLLRMREWQARNQDKLKVPD